MLPRFADIFQQRNRCLNWLEKQPEGSVRPLVIELGIFTVIHTWAETRSGIRIFTCRPQREE